MYREDVFDGISAESSSRRSGSQTLAVPLNLVAALAGGLTIVAFFFLPWVSVPFWNISALDLTVVGGLAGLGNLALIPLIGVLLVMTSLVGTVWTHASSQYVAVAGQILCAFGLWPIISLANIYSDLTGVVGGIARIPLPVGWVLNLGFGFHVAWICLAIGTLIGVANIGMNIMKRRRYSAAELY